MVLVSRMQQVESLLVEDLMLQDISNEIDEERLFYLFC
jgi:hypothetical protein